VARRPPHSEPTEQLDLEEQLFEPRMPDDGSPGRIIATMVGIVGILLLGSLFWSAMGALFSAFGEAKEALPVSRPALGLAVTAEPSVRPISTPIPTLQPTAVPTVAPTTQPTPMPTSAPTSAATSAPTATASGRSPWVLLPQPAPGSKIAPGPVVVEARARGDAAISSIQLELDGAALQVNVEQRAENTWRGAATARVGAGQHSARAIIIDAEGRRGAYRWTFEVGP
jgi:hypothetical protein